MQVFSVTAWARYDSRANVVTIHVLDLVDGIDGGSVSALSVRSG